MYGEQEQASAILLLCLGYERPEQPAQQIRAHDFVPLFQPFGLLRKVIIFSKTPVLKAFVEYTETRFARAARDYLHNSTLNDFLSVRLFFSNRESIICPGRFIDFWDSEKHNDEPPSPALSTFTLQRKNSLMPLEHKTTHYSDEVSSPELGRKMLGLSLDMTSSQGQFGEPESPAIATVIKRFSVYSTQPTHLQFDGDVSPQLPLTRRGSLPLTKVLLLSNLDNVFDCARELYALCRGFGGVVKVLLMRNLQKALIEFANFASAKSCLEFINRLYLEKLAVRATFSRYENIDPKRGNKSENSLQFNDLFIVPEQENQLSLANIKTVTPTPKISISAASNIQLDPNGLYYQIIECLNKVNIFTMSSNFELFVEGKVKVVFSMPTLRDAMTAVIKLDGANVKKCFLEAAFCS